ncbi:MAG TPA: peptidylprolyl isomerase, partial [bacterium]|nr:peptidylprolyl isomerase [bacterium]
VKDKLMVIKYTQWTLEKNPEYSDTYLIAYYEKQKAIFTHPERRKVQHILVAVGNDSKPEEVNKKLAKIKAAEKKLKAGANFEKIAKEYSECESKTNGGFIGYLEVKGNENDTITKTIVKLKENELSEIVKSERGYHILKVSEIKPSYTDAFDKVKDRLKLMYLLDKHKQNAKIEYKS